MRKLLSGLWNVHAQKEFFGDIMRKQVFENAEKLLSMETYSCKGCAKMRSEVGGST